MKNRKPKRSVFLGAAIRQSTPDKYYAADIVDLSSPFACKNLAYELHQWYVERIKNTPEYKMFVKYFKPDNFEPNNCWWDIDKNEKFNRNEARILALLLCAEMCRR